MQIEVLREFIAAAKYSSFRKAAEEVHITQPALSKHMAALEREIGFKLFYRNTGTSPSLTPAGEHFYTLVWRWLKEMDEGIRESKEIADQGAPVKVQMLGQEDSSLNKLLPSMKTPFRVVPLSREQSLVSALELGQTDLIAVEDAPILFGVMTEEQREGFCFQPVGKAELSFVVSNENPLGSKNSLARDDLRDVDMVEPFGNLYGFMDVVASECFEGLNINLVQDPTLPISPDNVPVADMGLRVAVCFRGAAHRVCQNRSDIVAIDELDGESYEAEEYLVYRNNNPNPNVKAFAQEAQKLLEKTPDVSHQ